MSLKRRIIPIAGLICLLCLPIGVKAQDEVVPAEQPTAQVDSESLDEAENRDILKETQKTVEEVAKTVDESEQAKEISAGILQPIYTLAEFLAFPAFHWVAFALMATGVVSFTLQLVLGKLVVLSRMGFSLREILSDAVYLAISLVGLVLTTQAATENSTFTQSPAAVLSATLAGAVLGFVLYLWGQTQELQAVKGRKVEVAQGKRD